MALVATLGRVGTGAVAGSRDGGTLAGEATDCRSASRLASLIEIVVSRAVNATSDASVDCAGGGGCASKAGGGHRAEQLRRRDRRGQVLTAAVVPLLQLLLTHQLGLVAL